MKDDGSWASRLRPAPAQQQSLSTADEAYYIAVGWSEVHMILHNDLTGCWGICTAV